jgi:transglutaminase-like putative cysteine protease
MARRADPTPGHQRLLGLAAVAALSVATALAFGRVFEGRLPTLELVAVALASVGVAVAFERRGLLLATLASLLGLTLAIAWIVLPQTTWYGIPSLRTLRALGRSLEFVGQQARERVAPTPPLPPLMLAAVTAVWTAAFSSHALAIRAGSPLLAVLPPIALVGFADTVLEDGARPVYAVVLLAAAIAVVFADGLRRVRQWGPVWAGSSKARRLGPSVRGSRPVALAVIAIAVLVPGLLPGFRSDPLVDLSSSTDNGALDPFVSIHAQLDGDAPIRDLFEVQAKYGQYWRLYTLDHFDGESWTSTNPDGSLGAQPISPPDTFPAADGETPPGGETLAQAFRILNDVPGHGALPMAQTPVTIANSNFGDLTWDAARGQAFSDGDLQSGMTYTVQSQIVVPTAQQVASLPLVSAPNDSPWTQLPADFDPRLTGIADDWTKNAPTDYEKVLAIQNHFHNGNFLYSKDVEPIEGQDALYDFLTTSKVGFCQQFAVAEATLLRALGIPARIAVGYQDGDLQDNGSFLVTTQDAHAWVEVKFPTYGWLPFDPTPGRGALPGATVGTYANPGQGGPGDPFDPPGGATGATGASGPGGPAGQQCENQANIPPQQRQLLCQTEKRPEHKVSGGGVPLPSIGTVNVPDESGYSVPYRKIGLGLLAAFVLFLIVMPIVKAVMRRRLLRTSREPREHVLAAYRVFDGEAADIGLGRREGETIEEHRARLMASVAFSDGHLGRLTSQAVRAAYASEGPSRSDADASAEDARLAIRDLRKEAGLLRRITGTYRPGL